MKIFKAKTSGFQFSEGDVYVIAEDAQSAFKKLSSRFPDLANPGLIEIIIIT